MRNQLKVDLKANLNKDAAATIQDLLEKHNALVAEYDALLAKLDADAGVTDADYVSTLASAAEVSID